MIDLAKVFEGAPDWAQYATRDGWGRVEYFEFEPFELGGQWFIGKPNTRYVMAVKRTTNYNIYTAVCHRRPSELS